MSIGGSSNPSLCIRITVPLDLTNLLGKHPSSSSSSPLAGPISIFICFESGLATNDFITTDRPPGWRAPQKSV